MKRIAVLTSGGDAPGMNCAIRSVVRAGLGADFEVSGIKRGYYGLFEKDVINMDSRSVGNIINKGGTILRTIRFPEFKEKQTREKCYKNLQELGIEGLVAIGGDGSANGAYALSVDFGFPVVFIPASIDNDVFGTDWTIGFDTAVNTAVEIIDKIRDTASSHERVFIIEVMGREHGFLALDIAIAAGAETAIIPEFPVSMEKIIKDLEENKQKGKLSSLIILAEGAGKAHDITEKIHQNLPDREVRYVVLGYSQRGGSPTYFSRELATIFGFEAIKMFKEKDYGKMVGISGNKIVRVKLSDVISGKKTISMEKLELLKSMAI
ncbi:MAG: 6-phosphofructokinase [Candidatus Omnitrophica bacterium]|nr:6-phosphofructokinase [Candidatus Omnitrophota bacterium]